MKLQIQDCKQSFFTFIITSSGFSSHMRSLGFWRFADILTLFCIPISVYDTFKMLRGMDEQMWVKRTGTLNMLKNKASFNV